MVNTVVYKGGATGGGTGGAGGASAIVKYPSYTPTAMGNLPAHSAGGADSSFSAYDPDTVSAMNCGVSNCLDICHAMCTIRVSDTMDYAAFQPFAISYDGYPSTSTMNTLVTEYMHDNFMVYQSDHTSGAGWYWDTDYYDPYTVASNCGNLLKSMADLFGSDRGELQSMSLLSGGDTKTWSSMNISGSINAEKRVIGVAIFMQKDSNGMGWTWQWCYSFSEICNFANTLSAPTSPSISNGRLTWTSRYSSSYYRTGLDFEDTGASSSYLGYSRATRDDAYQVMEQLTESYPANGVYKRGSAGRFFTSTIPVYYCLTGSTTSAFRSAFTSALSSAVSTINSALEGTGYQLGSPTSRSFSDDLLADYSDISTSLPLGVTIAGGDLDTLSGPDYTWGNWITQVSNGRILRGKALIYYTPDYPHPTGGLNAIVLEELVECLGTGNDLNDSITSVFSEMCTATKPETLSGTDADIVTLRYSTDPFDSLEHAGVELRASIGRKNISSTNSSCYLGFLSPGRTYNLYLRHFYTYSDAYSSRVSAGQVTVPTLGMPTISGTERRDGGGVFRWTAGTNATGYNLVVISNWDGVEQVNIDTSNLYYTYTGLPYGVTHTVKVRSYMTWGGTTLYSSWSQETFTTNPARPTAAVSVSKGVITVNWSLEDTSSNVSYVYFTLYNSSGTTVLQSKNFTTTSGTFSFSKVDEGTYLLKAQSQFNINGTTLCCLTNTGAEYKLETSIKVSNRPEKFYWSDYTSALYAGGAVQDMSYTAWNAFVDNIKAVIENAGFGSTTMPSSSTNYGSAASKSFSTALGSYARMSANSELSKRYFNVCNYIIDYVASNTVGVSTGIGVKYAHDSDYPVSYSDFITLQNRLNAIP